MSVNGEVAFGEMKKRDHHMGKRCKSRTIAGFSGSAWYVL